MTTLKFNKLIYFIKYLSLSITILLILFSVGIFDKLINFNNQSLSVLIKHNITSFFNILLYLIIIYIISCFLLKSIKNKYDESKLEELNSYFTEHSDDIDKKINCLSNNIDNLKNEIKQNSRDTINLFDTNLKNIKYYLNRIKLTDSLNETTICNFNKDFYKLIRSKNNKINTNIEDLIENLEKDK